ncbi:RNA-directed DNA polymerase [Priestia flexa]|uniref:RNA-directed DNA polymerase n=1 Tax=Priestia flexa TaxID=86664 RepID=UPI00249365BB|nr:RNA-directed DNA polymerase [Priestia flexa]
MTEKSKFNRQKSDFLLTDLLPYEKGNHYTHRYFYEYLQEEKKTFKNLFRNLQKKEGSFSSKWHSSPLKFIISKKEEGFREISFINPLGLIEALAFIQLFENDILNVIHNKKDFSARKASRTNSLTYKKDKKQVVHYSDRNSKNQLLISLESSGTYFKHFPFKTITQLLNDKRFIYSRDKFDLLLKIDIQDCFPSIYSHSYKWLITNKTYDSKKLKESTSLYSNIDAFLQNINGSKTNGIIVGPEISRLLADFLFVHIDQEIIEKLACKNLVFKRDYTIYRFVDDYFIFSKNEEVQLIIKDVITNSLNKYHLKINESKVSKLGRYDTTNEWLIEVLPVIELIEKIFDSESHNLYSNVEAILKESISQGNYTEGFPQVAAAIEQMGEKKRRRFVKYIDLRSRVISSIESSNEKSLICSYILSTILRKIEERNSEDLLLNMSLNELITFIFFIYSTNVNYSSTQKIIRIFSLLIDINQDDLIEMIERNFERFEEDIYTKFSSDWVDLLLFFANYQVNLPHKSIERITDIFIEEQNPVHLAALCIFAESECVNSTQIIRSVNKLVKHRIEKINWGDFFQDENGWWVFTFLSYPKLNSTVKRDLLNKLSIIKLGLNANNSVNCAKLMVLNFLLDNEKHFIEWSFTKENYYNKFYFYTKNRTVFNPDVIDQISISR